LTTLLSDLAVSDALSWSWMT